MYPANADMAARSHLSLEKVIFKWMLSSVVLVVDALALSMQGHDTRNEVTCTRRTKGIDAND